MKINNQIKEAREEIKKVFLKETKELQGELKREIKNVSELDGCFWVDELNIRLNKIFKNKFGEIKCQ